MLHYVFKKKKKINSQQKSQNNNMIQLSTSILQPFRKPAFPEKPKNSFEWVLSFDPSHQSAGYTEHKPSTIRDKTVINVTDRSTIDISNKFAEYLPVHGSQQKYLHEACP